MRQNLTLCGTTTSVAALVSILQDFMEEGDVVRLSLRSCIKCKGDVVVDRDEHGWYEHCLQCGHSHDIESLVEAHEPHRENEYCMQSGHSHDMESLVEIHEPHREREKPQPIPTSSQKTKVSTFSHQPLLQEGILHSLSHTEDIQVISQDKASDKESIIKILPADVVIVDVDGLSDSGQSLACRLKQHLPSVGIIVLTSNPSDDQLFQAVENGVATYLSKEITGDQLAEMVRRVAHGECPTISESLSSRYELVRKILSQFQELSRNTEDNCLIAHLTARETEILNYVAQGYSNKQIAVEFTTSKQTIKNHIASIMVKLNATNRTKAVVIAAQQGLISIA